MSEGAKMLETLLANLHAADPERMARAADQGYDTSKIYLHGTDQDFHAFNPDKINGLWSTDHPHIAEEYAERGDGTGENLKPLFAKYGKNQFNYDDGSISYSDGTSGTDTPDSQFVEIPSYPGPSGTNLMVNDPKQYRSIFANFDPAKKDSKDLLASAGTLGAGVAGTSLISPDDADAAPIPIEDFIANLEKKAATKAGKPQVNPQNISEDITDANPPSFLPDPKNTNGILRSVQDQTDNNIDQLKQAFNSDNSLSKRAIAALMGGIGIIGVPETSLAESAYPALSAPGTATARTLALGM